MQLISGFSVENFRSIRRLESDHLKSFSVFCGLNNSGKSNVLRSLNLFFNNEIENGAPLDFGQDLNKHQRSRKQKQQISVEVTFELPKQFNFRKELEGSKKLFGGKSFRIKKEWTKDPARPGQHVVSLFLNGRESDITERGKLEQFLSLIKFRYIPNRISPLDVIKSESDAVKDSLVRRLKAAKGADSQFTEIQKKAESLIGDIGSKYAGTLTDFEKIRLATPQSWADLIFDLGFRVEIGKGEVEDSFQGSGAQSILMIETLRMVDEDYYKRFGWRQATIWAFEEPETSLHHSLEAHVASLLAEISASERLQVLATTHSNLVLQYSNKAYLIERENRTSIAKPLPSIKMLDDVWDAGITSWQHPLLSYPDRPTIIVEGKFDYNLFLVVRGLLPGGLKYRITFLEEIDAVAGAGGTDSLYKYLRNNTPALKARQANGPIIILLDWDAAKEVEKYEKIYQGPNYYVRAWQEGDLNPDLDASIRGTERALGTEFIKRTCDEVGITWYEAKGKIAIHSADKSAFKNAMNKAIVSGTPPNDLKYVIRFFAKLVNDVAPQSQSNLDIFQQ